MAIQRVKASLGFMTHYQKEEGRIRRSHLYCSHLIEKEAKVKTMRDYSEEVISLRGL